MHDISGIDPPTYMTPESGGPCIRLQYRLYLTGRFLSSYPHGSSGNNVIQSRTATVF